MLDCRRWRLDMPDGASDNGEASESHFPSWPVREGRKGVQGNVADVPGLIYAGKCGPICALFGRFRHMFRFRQTTGTIYKAELHQNPPARFFPLSLPPRWGSHPMCRHRHKASGDDDTKGVYRLARWCLNRGTGLNRARSKHPQAGVFRPMTFHHS